jgi:hypothetical protein
LCPRSPLQRIATQPASKRSVAARPKRHESCAEWTQMRLPKSPTRLVVRTEYGTRVLRAMTCDAVCQDSKDYDNGNSIYPAICRMKSNRAGSVTGAVMRIDLNRRSLTKNVRVSEDRDRAGQKEATTRVRITVTRCRASSTCRLTRSHETATFRLPSLSVSGRLMAQRNSSPCLFISPICPQRMASDGSRSFAHSRGQIWGSIGRSEVHWSACDVTPSNAGTEQARVGAQSERGSRNDPFGGERY